MYTSWVNRFCKPSPPWYGGKWRNRGGDKSKSIERGWAGNKDRKTKENLGNWDPRGVSGNQGPREKYEGTRPPHAEDAVFRSIGRESRSRKDAGSKSREDGHHRISMEKQKSESYDRRGQGPTELLAQTGEKSSPRIDTWWGSEWLGQSRDPSVGK